MPMYKARSLLVAALSLLCLDLSPLGVADNPSRQDTSAPALGERVVRVRGDWGYPPFEFLDSSGEPRGFNIDILKRIGELSGLRLEVDLGPWAEVRAQLERGEIDLIAGMYRSPEREALVDFASPQFTSSYGIFALPDSRVKSLMDLPAARIAVQRGDLGHDYALKRGLGAELVVVEDWEDVFGAVFSGRADCAFSALVQGARALQYPRYGELRVVGTPLFQEKYSMAVRKGDADLLATLNEGLFFLKASGEYDRIYDEWFGIYENRRVTQSPVFRTVAVLSLIALGLGLLVLIWSFTLRRQVRAKTAALSRELAAREEAQRRLESALADADRAGAALKEAERVKALFLASVSHELRTPLHGIVGVSRLLARSELDEDQRRLAGLLEASCFQLSRLFEDLLDPAGSASGRMSLAPTSFRLDELASWLEPMLRANADERGLSLKFEVEGGARRLFADKDRIAQIVINLTINAIKYTERGAVSVRIFATERDLEIIVADTGPGIPEHDQRNIFDPFFRGERGEVSAAAGFGLGLSIVKSLVDLMGGIVRFETREGEGTTFFVLLPLPSTAEPSPRTPPDSRERAGSGAPAAAASRRPGKSVSFAGRRVIVAEDEAINRLYVLRSLSEAGFDAVPCKDGVAALEAYSAAPESFDLILMDMTMPRLDGMEATKRIRQLETTGAFRRVPIIALTAHSTSVDRSSYDQAGMDGFLSKPFAEKAFWAEINRVLAPALSS